MPTSLFHLQSPLLKMDSPSSPFVSLSLLLLGFLLLTKIPSCSSKEDGWYTKCSNNFTCGSLTATYPFWGASRPSGCGIPELELTCEAETTAITIKNVKYMVLEIDPDAQTMRIARQDFLSGICPSQFLNTSLDPPLIDYLSGYTNITFLYGCWTAPVAIKSVQLSCVVPGTPYQGGFITAGDFMAGLCYTSVSFPVRTDILTEILNLTLLQDGIRQGFGVKWNSSRDGFACGECTRSSGVCGYDVRTGISACYCRDQSNGVKICPASTATNSSDSYPENTSCDACELSGGRCGFNTSSGAFSCHCSDQFYASVCPMNAKSQSGSATTTIRSGQPFSSPMPFILL